MRNAGAANAGYNTRLAESEGTALGALALPWTFAGLLVLSIPGAIPSADTLGTGRALGSHAASDFPLYALRCTLAASGTTLASLLLRQHVLGVDRARRQLPNNAGVDHSSQSSRSAARSGNSSRSGKVTAQRGLQPHASFPAASQLAGSSPEAARGDAAVGASTDGGQSSAVSQSTRSEFTQLGTGALSLALLSIASVQVYSQVWSKQP